MPLNRPRYSNTERIGVSAVQSIISSEFGWIFREQPIDDMGIDAQIERVDDGNPSGKLLAVQIKTGESYLEEKGNSYFFRGKNVHLDYWTNHSLPVLLVVHLPNSNETVWVLVDEKSVTRMDKGWKIEIPKTNTLTDNNIREISSAFEGSKSQQRMRKLVMDEPIMRHIEKGGKVSVELEEWVNKSLSRTPIKIYIIDENGDEKLEQALFYYYTARTIEEFAQEIFPWASISIDIDFYDEHQDYEDYEYAQWKSDINFAERKPLLIYPYMNSCGEVDAYRIELKLNDLGTSYLTVSDHMMKLDE